MRVSGVWRTGVVVLAVFAAAWTCAIVWWRVGNVTPGGTGMLVWLLAVPVAILVLLWIVARLRRRKAARAEEPAADAEAEPTTDDAAPRQWPLGILAGEVNLGCGEGAQALAGRLAELPRPGLHPTLRDRDGLPVLAACSEDLDTTSVADRLPLGPGQRLVEEHLRALALLEPVALELFDAAARLLPPLPQAAERVVAGLRRSEAPPPRESGSVHVVALLPQDMPSSLRTGCDEWLRGLADDAGLDPRRSTFEVTCVSGADEIWQRLGRLVADEPAAGADWQLLLAACSSIGERGLHALNTGGRLATAGNVEGLVPGEGAAGLLLRPEGSALPTGDGTVPALAAVHAGALEAGSNPRHAARATGNLLGELMGMGDVSRDDIAMVLSDADQRPSRSVEAAVASSAACPELDPAGDCPALGSASGHLGHVAPLALLALASARVRDAEAPVLALSVASAKARTAALVRVADAVDIPESASNETGAKPDLAA